MVVEESADYELQPCRRPSTRQVMAPGSPPINEGVIHRGSGVLSQSGPHFHNWLVANAAGVSPLNGRSAGYLSAGAMIPALLWCQLPNLINPVLYKGFPVLPYASYPEEYNLQVSEASRPF